MSSANNTTPIMTSLPDPNPQALLFGELPSFDVPMPQDELQLLAALPDYAPDSCVVEVPQEDYAIVRRLERRGLVKVHRWKTDPCDHWPSLFAGRLSQPVAPLTPPSPSRA